MGSKETPLTEFTIAYMPSMYSLSFFVTDPHAKDVFSAVPMEWPHSKSMVHINR